MGTMTTDRMLHRIVAPGVVQMIVALVLSSFGLVFVVTAQWPLDVAALDRGGSALSFSDAAPSWKAATASLGMAAYAGGILLLARWSPLRSAFGARLPHGPRPWVLLVRLSALYVVAMLLSQYVLSWLSSSSSSSVSTTYASYSLSDRLVSSVWASTWEETFDVAVPIGFVCFAWWVLRTLRAPFGMLVGPPVRVPAWCLLAAAFGLVTRFLDHLYQGVDAAAAVVGVGLIAVSLFAWGGSVLPLIVGHLVYDVAVAARPVLPSGELTGAVLNWVVLAAVLVLTCVPSLRARRAAPRGQESDAGRERVNRGR
jgi:hypothetical protein